MSSFNHSKYKRAEEVFQELRSRSRHWESVSRQDAEGRVWDPSSFKIDKDYGSGRGSEFRAIKHYDEFMKNNFVGGSDTLRRENIGIWYMIMSDVRRDSVMGANTRGVRGWFEWESLQCKVSLHAGVVSKLTSTMNTTSMLQSNMTERNTIVKATGWATVNVQQMSADNITTLQTLTRSASGGHQKFTRLVKGCLLYMDLLLHGAQMFDDVVPDTIRYEPADVLTSFRRSNTSYSYCSKPESLPYTLVLGLIGMEYPFPSGRLICRGSVTVPSDADRHVVVCRGNPTVGKVNCLLTHTTVWTSIVHYAREMRVGDQLESAMITAASLYENRYLREVSLPKVESTIDLIRPMFVDCNEDDSQKPRMDSDAMIGVGRVHQMSCLLVAKDMIIAAKNTTKRGFNYESVVSNYLKSQETVVMRMSEWATPTVLMKSTSQMRWMGSLSEDDIRDLDTISIFEGFWLCDDKTRSIEKGGIQCLLNGVNDGMRSNGFIDLLVDEMLKFGVEIDRSQIAAGRFSVRRRCLVYEDTWEPEEVKFVEKSVKLVHPCNYKVSIPNTHARKVRVKQVRSFSRRDKAMIDEQHALEEELRRMRDYHQRKEEEAVLERERERVVSDRERHKLQVLHEKERLDRDKMAGKPKHSTSRSFDGKGLVGIELPGIARDGWMEKSDVRRGSLGRVQFGDVTEMSGGSRASDASSGSVAGTITEIEDLTKEAGSHIIEPTGRKKPKVTNITSEVMKKSEEEVAVELGSGFTGVVSTVWSDSTLKAIRNSKGWENFMKGRGVNPTGRVLGRDVMDFCNEAIEYDETFSNINYVTTTLMDSRTRVSMEYVEIAIRDNRLQNARILEPITTDSMGSADLGIGDAVVAGWMLDDMAMASSLSRVQRNRLIRHFRMPPHLRAALQRLDR